MTSLKEIRTLVDEIRAYVTSLDRTNDPRMAERALQYALHCREANERLQRCADLLERGHRGEAISLAEADPDLLTVVSVLGFPELDAWQEVVGEYGWERSQLLKVEVAHAVNTAYAVESELAERLREHRRLALSQAPLPQRLRAMRELAKIDSSTAFWADDIAVFEQRRCEELLRLGTAVSQRQDAAGMKQFVNEFEAEDWNAPVPDRLQQTYRQLLLTHHSQHTLPQLASQIQGTLRTLNRDALKSLKQEWDRVIGSVNGAAAGWKTPVVLNSVVQPAFEFLRQQEENDRLAAYQADVNALLEAVRHEEENDRITFLLAAAESHGYPLPMHVHGELAHYRRLAQESKILSVSVIIALVLAGVAALVMTYFFVLR